MNQQTTTGIILARTDYGEADRILTILTPDHGKLRALAKGVRRVKSKLAGGIELFSVSNITFIRGRGELATLVSTRLIKYYDTIVRDIGRVQLGYELIKQLNKATEDEPEAEYFSLLEQAFEALDDASISADLIAIWFQAQLLRIAGVQPNLRHEASGEALSPEQTYDFDFDAMALQPRSDGIFKTDHIKLLRLLFSPNQPRTLQQIAGLDALLPAVVPAVRTMHRAFANI